METEFSVIQSGTVLGAEIAPQIRAGYEAAQNAAIGSHVGELVPVVTTTDDPANHVTPTGAPLDGVAHLRMGFSSGPDELCTGSLLPTGGHILTAAHCIFDDSGFPATSLSTTFDLPGGSPTISANAVVVHGGFNGSPVQGNDIALVQLVSFAPSDAQRFDIYRATDEVGQTFEKAGDGLSGTGLTGSVLPAGTKRDGGNRVDALGEALNGTVYQPGTVTAGVHLVYDFDSGLVANDASGFFLGINDVGLGNDEVMVASGDSGGPALIDGKIAGVSSFIQGFTGFTDALAGTNSSFGEFAVDTRVSAFASWIDNFIDIVPPDVIATSPVDGQTIVANATDIDVTFSETVTGVNAPGDLTLSGAGALGATVGDPPIQVATCGAFPSPA